MLTSVTAEQRVVDLRPRTILRVLLIVLAVAITLEVIWIARHVLAWVVIALFLALALAPFVSWIERRGHIGRAPAIAIAYLVVLIVVVAVGATFIPKLIDEVNGFIQALPNYVHDLTHGRGRLGFLERKYHVVEKVRTQVKDGGATKVLGLSGAALSVTKSVITIIAATVTIVFLTFFMLLEGADVGRARLLALPRALAGALAQGRRRHLQDGRRLRHRQHPDQRDRRRIGDVVLLIMGVPYAVALGLLVAVLDLIPLAGATVAGLIVVLVSRSCTRCRPGSSLAIFVIVYQQLENHFLQPVIYGRTVQLSPLAVLISVLVGAELAGILGALAAIPVAGSIQVIVRDQFAARRGVVLDPGPSPSGPAARKDPPVGPLSRGCPA